MLILFAVGSLIGAASLNFFSVLPEQSVLGTLGVSFAGIAIITWLVKKQSVRNVCMMFLGIILGFSWAYVQAYQILRWQLPSKDFQKIVEITGKVTGISQLFEDTLRFDIKISHYDNKLLTNPVKIRLYWYQPKEPCLDGDKLIARVKLKPPWHLANPGSFDTEKQLFLEGIRATGRVIDLRAYQSSDNRSLSKIRQHLNNRLAELIGEKPLLGVIQATTLGIYKNITPAQWQVFQATGTSHAIAISGLHVTLVATFIGYLFTGFSRRFVFLTMYLPAQCYGALGALLGAIGYSAITGFSVPTLRSLVMIVVALIAVLKRQMILTWHSLAIAWLGIGIIDPFATLQMGFWLSFGSVAALIYASTHEGENRWQRWVYPQIIAFIGIVPLCAIFFHQLAILSPLANLIVLPIINLVVIPASLIGVALVDISDLFATLSLSLAHSALAITWLILEKIAQLPYSLWHIKAMPQSYLFLTIFGTILVLAPKGLPGKNVGWLCFLPMIFYQPKELRQGECLFTLLDVGQGLAAVIQTQRHALLFDAGPEKQNVIRPFLKYQGIQKLDKVIISHSDEDHRGGLKKLENFHIEEIYTSEPHRLTKDSTQCQSNQSWEWDGVKFMILNPSTLLQKRNNLSCVLKIQASHHSILLTGDIESPAENVLLENFSDKLPSSILVVPHHGSMTSSSLGFVRKVSPEYALYPVGLANQYHLPKATILERYRAIGSRNLVTYQTGAIMFHLDNQEVFASPIFWREVSSHYWHK